jgi:ribosomal protein L37E
MRTTKPNRHITQIGDSDSGRFFKLQPVLQSKSDGSGQDEDDLDHRHLVAAMNGLFDREDFSGFTGQGWFEGGVVRSLAGNVHFPSYFLETSKNREDTEATVYTFPGFGLYIYRSKNMYLAVRCGPIGQKGNGGHAHNDNLSFELNVKGRDFIVDGGTYLYTPLPSIRNEFRSTRAHNTVAVDGYEQNRWESGLKGLFSMKDDAQGHVLGLSAEYIRAEHSGFGQKHYRQFTWQEPFLIIEDVFDAGCFGEINLNLSPDVEVSQQREIGPEEYYLKLLNEGVVVGIYLKGLNHLETADGFYSPGYGRRVKNQRIRCQRSGRDSLIKVDTGQ